MKVTEATLFKMCSGEDTQILKLEEKLIEDEEITIEKYAQNK